MIGDMLRVWEKNGSCIDCAPGARGTLEDAMTLYLGEPGREFLPDADRDRLIPLATIAGEPYTVLASQVTSWKLSTRESRAECRRMDALMEAEVAEDKRRFPSPSVTVPEAEAAS